MTNERCPEFFFCFCVFIFFLLLLNLYETRKRGRENRNTTFGFCLGMNRNPGSDTAQDEDQTSFDPISRNGKPWGLFESFAGCAHEPLPVTLTISDKQRPLKDSKQKTQKQPKKKGPPASSTARVKRISSLYFGLSMAKEHEGSSSQKTR